MSAKRAGGSGEATKFLRSNIEPVDWLKIGLNSVEEITLLSLRIPLEVNSEIQVSSYELLQPSG